MENAIDRHVGGRPAKLHRAAVKNFLSSRKKRIEWRAQSTNRNMRDPKNIYAGCLIICRYNDRKKKRKKKKLLSQKANIDRWREKTGYVISRWCGGFRFNRYFVPPDAKESFFFSALLLARTARRCARSFACRPFVLAARDVSRRLSLDSTSRHCAAAVAQRYFSSSVLQNERARTHERSSSSVPCRSCRSIVFFRHGAEIPARERRSESLRSITPSDDLWKDEYLWKETFLLPREHYVLSKIAYNLLRAFKGEPKRSMHDLWDLSGFIARTGDIIKIL